MMYRLFLTIDIDVNDRALPKLKGVIKINYGELLSSSNDTSQKLNKPDELRTALLSQEIEKGKTDLMVGFALNKPEHFQAIAPVIRTSEYKLQGVFFDKGQRAEQKVKEYDKLYEKHGRWLDYAPDATKAQTMQHLFQVKRLVQILREWGIECIGV